MERGVKLPSAVGVDTKPILCAKALRSPLVAAAAAAVALAAAVVDDAAIPGMNVDDVGGLEKVIAIPSIVTDWFD